MVKRGEINNLKELVYVPRIYFITMSRTFLFAFFICIKCYENDIFV